jgi:hypothetical protein
LACFHSWLRSFGIFTGFPFESAIGSTIARLGNLIFVGRQVGCVGSRFVFFVGIFGKYCSTKFSKNVVLVRKKQFHCNFRK